MKIRSYTNADFEEVAQIYNLSKADEFSGEDTIFEVTPLQEDKRMLELFDNSQIYVYEENFILGFIGNKGNYISWLFVHPEYRNKSIGKRLVISLLSTLTGTITLNVAKSNIAARKLYTNLGFTVERTFEGKYQGLPIVVNRMRCER